MDETDICNRLDIVIELLKGMYSKVQDANQIESMGATAWESTLLK